MVRRALRAALATSLLLVFWTIARPAHAMPAPFCDDRGASAIAPPPALEPLDEAIARARLTSCDEAAGLPLRATIDGGQRLPAPPSAGPGALLPPAPAYIPPAPGDPLDTPAEAARPIDGVRGRVERPPRG